MDGKAHQHWRHCFGVARKAMENEFDMPTTILSNFHSINNSTTPSSLSLTAHAMVHAVPAAYRGFLRCHPWPQPRQGSSARWRTSRPCATPLFCAPPAAAAPAAGAAIAAAACWVALLLTPPAVVAAIAGAGAGAAVQPGAGLPLRSVGCSQVHKFAYLLSRGRGRWMDGRADLSCKPDSPASSLAVATKPTTYTY